MEGPIAAEVMATPIHHPSSPPITPNSHESGHRIRGVPPPNPNWKRMALYGGNFSPPSDNGSSQHSRSRPATPENLFVPRNLSRPSTASGLDDSPGRHRATPEIDSLSDASSIPPSLRQRQRDDFELVIEEIPEDDPRYMNRSGILRPDDCEDADSVRAPSSYHDEETDVVKQLRDLHCDDEEQEEKEVRRYNEKKKKRRSIRSKRTFSESVGSDMDDEDTKYLDFNEVGASARRVKRRLSRPNDRTSLIFDDPPPERITEVDEPDDETDWVDPPPSYSPIDWSMMPFYSVPGPDPMKIDSDSESDSDSDSDTEAAEED
ncbi:hypothetical protein NA57DRAFT_73687 [Rhizodiscina lignyota]|uniref:Uncharacterized protein n=1 Tax=Rhizodiscina lignyota TaxID=1504668 RepID=A0A9P4IQ91_9PEZI|nr:hypothetical protein NA57DRAFT_73687 [Rhizodiscina lignyota]